MAKRVGISFLASGYIKQVIELSDDCGLTNKQIVEKLNDGTIVTTIQEGGTIEFVLDGKVIGAVAYVDNNLEYTDFELNPNENEN